MIAEPHERDNEDAGDDFDAVWGDDDSEEWEQDSDSEEWMRWED